MDLLNIIDEALANNWTRLSLANRNLSMLPNRIIELQDLTEINLSLNKFRVIPKELLALKKLKKINLSHNELTSLPDEISTFKNLTKLHCRHNQISIVTSKIKELAELNILDLSDNNIYHLPDEIWELINLKRIDLFNNKISQLPDGLRRLKSLEEIDIRANPITELPYDIKELPKLTFLKFDAEKISNIPKEISRQRLKSVVNYIESLEDAEEIDYLYEAKMVVLGRGFVGKTTLCKKLINPNLKVLEIEGKSTEGIDIGVWDIPTRLDKSNSFRFNIWDFGGQEKYDTTHQFFITERSLYLFVTESRQESNYLDFDYWLNIVQLLSNNSPIIVVQNKIDFRVKQLPTQLYKNHFESIFDFINVSCADNYLHTIENLIASIKSAISLLPQVGDRLPITWVDIRRELKNDTRDHISFDEYIKICEKYGLSREKATFLSEYLHNLGAIVHYRKDPLLRRIVIINPDWAVDGVYKVLDTRKIEKQNGLFNQEDFDLIWSDNRFKNEHPELLQLMKNFGLCFETKEPNIFIIPELLSADPPHNYIKFNDDNNLKFIYEYSFMPAGILTRFIATIHNYIADNIFWKHGVIISLEGTTAEVIEDQINKKVFVTINGENKKGLLAIIRNTFVSIHKYFHQLEFNELIPCNCTYYRKNPESRNFYRYIELIRFQKTLNKYSKECSQSGISVRINSLIDDVIEDRKEEENLLRENKQSAEKKHEKDKQNNSEIFFSYAWGDDKEVAESREKIVDELYESLSKDGYSLRRDKYDLDYKGFISDFMIKIGQGNYIVVVISQKYLKSPFCMFELYEIARNSNFNKYEFSHKVFPIMIDFIDFTKPKILEEYFSYWETEYTEWDSFVKKRASQLSIEQLQRFDKVRMIYQNLGKLTDWLIDMNTLNPKLLTKDNFLEIKKAIQMQSGLSSIPEDLM